MLKPKIDETTKEEINLACLWVEKEVGVVFSERGIRDVFYRLDFSYTRPTYVLVSQEAVKNSYITFSGVIPVVYLVMSHIMQNCGNGLRLAHSRPD